MKEIKVITHHYGTLLIYMYISQLHGAVEKDGPSAGVTISTAVLAESLFSGHCVHSRLTQKTAPARI